MNETFHHPTSEPERNVNQIIDSNTLNPVIRLDKPGIIFKKICDVMKDIDAISKDRTNTQQGFKFRGIDDVYNELHSTLAQHGVFTVPEIVNRHYKERTTKAGAIMMERILTIKYTFYAEDGSSVVAVVDGEAMDTGDKTSNKCMSIAHKYAFLQVFCIPTVDDKDPDAVGPEAYQNQGPPPKPPVKPKAPVVALAPKPPAIPEADAKKHWAEIETLLPLAQWDKKTLITYIKDVIKKSNADLNKDDFEKITFELYARRDEVEFNKTQGK